MRLTQKHPDVKFGKLKIKEYQAVFPFWNDVVIHQKYIEVIIHSSITEAYGGFNYDDGTTSFSDKTWSLMTDTLIAYEKEFENAVLGSEYESALQSVKYPSKDNWSEWFKGEEADFFFHEMRFANKFLFILYSNKGGEAFEGMKRFSESPIAERSIPIPLNIEIEGWSSEMIERFNTWK
jgi:hypothetical protein